VGNTGYMKKNIFRSSQIHRKVILIMRRMERPHRLELLSLGKLKLSKNTLG